MFVDFLTQLMGPIVAGIQWILDFIWPSAGLYGVDANKVLEFTIPVVVIIPTVLLATILERKRPIENHDTQEARATIRTEWMLVAFMATIGIFLEIEGTGWASALELQDRMASCRHLVQHATMAPDSSLGRAETLRQELLLSLSDHGCDLRNGPSSSARRVPGNWAETP